jgi:hypothetical protein
MWGGRDEDFRDHYRDLDGDLAAVLGRRSARWRSSCGGRDPGYDLHRQAGDKAFDFRRADTLAATDEGLGLRTPQRVPPACPLMPLDPDESIHPPATHPGDLGDAGGWVGPQGDAQLARVCSEALLPLL